MKWLMLLLLVSIPSIADAACSGSSPTWTAASAGRTDVSDCNNAAAATGDTVNVPAGDVTWATFLNVNTKDIVWAGAGNGTDPASNTIIRTGSAGFCFRFGADGSVSPASRMTNFRFVGCTIGMRGLNPAKSFRIDHNYFDSTVSVSWNIAGGPSAATQPPSGLIDHNTFVYSRLVVNGTTTTALTTAAGNTQPMHNIWSTDPDFGGSTGVYIEDNIMSQDATKGLPGVVDCNYGGRYVFRYNTVTIHTTYANEVHGVQGPNRACQRWEIYRNTMTLTGAHNFTMSMIRGGSGFHFDNVLSGPGFDYVALDVERANYTFAHMGLCDGVSTTSINIDGVSAANVDKGYPCHDQIGRSRDDSQYTGTFMGDAGAGVWPTQMLTPVYIWNTAQAGIQVPGKNYLAGTDSWNTENRDFYNFSAIVDASVAQTVGVRVGTLAQRPASCTSGVGYWATNQGSWNTSGNGDVSGVLSKCTATNTWNVLYTPYTYPHPLQGITTPPAPSAPTGVRMLSSPSANDATLLWTMSTATTDFKGYHIYCGLAAGSYSLPMRTITPASAAASHSPLTQYTLRGTTAGTYYCIVKEVNTQDLESAASAEASLALTGMSARQAR